MRHISIQHVWQPRAAVVSPRLLVAAVALAASLAPALQPVSAWAETVGNSGTSLGQADVIIHGKADQQVAATSVSSDQTSNIVVVGNLTAKLTGNYEWDTVSCHVNVNGSRAGADVRADLSTQEFSQGQGSNLLNIQNTNMAIENLGEAVLSPIGFVSGLPAYAGYPWQATLDCSVASGSDTVTISGATVQAFLTTAPSTGAWLDTSKFTGGGVDISGPFNHVQGPAGGSFWTIMLNPPPPGGDLVVFGSVTASLNGQDEWDTAECNIGGENQRVDLSTQKVNDAAGAVDWTNLHVAQRPITMVSYFDNLPTTSPTQIVMSCDVPNGSDHVYFQNPNLVAMILPQVVGTNSNTAVAVHAATEYTTVASLPLQVPANTDGSASLPMMAFASVDASLTGDDQWDGASCVLQYQNLFKRSPERVVNLDTAPAVYQYSQTIFGAQGGTARDTQVRQGQSTASVYVPANSQFSWNPEMFELLCTVSGADTVTFSNPTLVAFPVGQLSQTITFGPLANATYGDAPISLNATASSQLPVTYSVGPSDPCAVQQTGSGWSVAITGAGTCTITAKQPGNGDYAAAPGVSQLLHIAKAPLTVFAQNTGMTYGSPVPHPQPVYWGFVNGDTASVLSGAPDCRTDAPANVGGGNHPGANVCTLGSLVSANYTFTFQPGTLKVTAATLQITASSASMVYGGPVPTITPIYQGFVNGDGPGSLQVQPRCDVGVSSTTPPGTYQTHCHNAQEANPSDPNYVFKYQDGTLTITP